ncbi:hypothetical protein DFH08DRAFT_1088650 [Mycena albidolilacea]|uniref:Uncharacterized protein n=1 Tax=Mycena albidolilacea TaxID=1033008 RepID=A0AAD6Z5A3_9AGAR|nr:hypothetical protein DFH08DRAFT_1088650 [Mycena albidolilacea]
MPTCRNQITEHAIASRTKHSFLSFHHERHSHSKKDPPFLSSYPSFIPPRIFFSAHQRQRPRRAHRAPPTGAGGDALSTELLLKAFARTINTAQKKGKRRKIDTQIHPGETLTRFNKCVALSFPFLFTILVTSAGYAGEQILVILSFGLLSVLSIETDVRPLVCPAVQSSLATVRAQHKKGAAPAEPTSFAAPMNSKTLKSTPASKPKSTPASKTASKPNTEAAPTPIDKHAFRPKELPRTSAAAPCRLDDIARAPPELSAFGRKKSANPTSFTARDGRCTGGCGKEVSRVEGFEARCGRRGWRREGRRVVGEGEDE